ncbi:MAG: hypothetical protein Q9187_007725, partial [Circinaria calcarea]
HYILQNTERPQILQEELQHISILVGRAKDKLLELDELIQYRLVKPESISDQIKVSKREWARAKDSIERFRQSLRDIRLNIATHMIVVNSSHQSRIGLTIDEIHVISGQLRSNHHLSSDHTSQQLDEHSRLLASISSSQSSLQGLLQLQPSATTQAHHPTNVGDSSPSSIICIRAYSSQRSPCTSYCTCACHKVRTFQSPALLHKAIGTLFLGYCGYPMMGLQNCTNTDCLSQSSFRTYVHYLFPSWILAKILIITLASSSLDKISVSLTVRRIVSPGAEIFRLTQSDDVDGLKRLFSKGLASPNDSLSDGQVPLISALSSRKLKACKFLLEAGADPLLKLMDGKISAFEFGWNAILAVSEDQAVLDTLRNLFPDKDSHLEERQFSILHKTVLKLISRNLEEELAICRSDIDRIDSEGNTALLWAARRGDSTTVDLLLRANANPNLVNRLDVSPLIHAARRSDPTCVKLLLKAGADPNQVDDQDYNALHYAAEYQNSREMIEYLVKGGVDVNKRNYWGSTPVAHAAINNRPISAEALLDYGADLNSLDLERDTPLTESIRLNADNTTELLLHRGAAYTSSNIYGDTILHLVGLAGGLKTLSIFQAAELKGIDPDATNNNGKTAIQIAREREGKPHGFIPQFQDLLAGIRARNESLEVSSQQDTDLVSPDSTSGSPGYLSFLAKWVRQLLARSINRRSSPSWPPCLSTAVLHTWTRWGLRFFWAHWVLSLCCAGLLYLFLSFEVMRRLRMVWDMLEPGGFEEV